MIISFKKAFLVVLIPFAAAFILSCLFRAMNAVLIPTIEKTFQFKSSAIGLITATYFLAYALFQIPLGILLDKYGARKIQASLYLLAGIGFVVYALSNSVWKLSAAHFLIGIGMAGGLMSALKIIVQWFPKEKIPMINGLMMMSGGLGILLAATPTEKLAGYLGWTGINLSFAFLTFLVALIIFFFVPEKQEGVQRTSFRDHYMGVINIYKDKFFWRLSPITITVLGSFMAIHDLWVENWLKNINHYTQAQINNCLLIVGVAMTVSLFCTGYIAKMAKRLRQPTDRVLAVGASLFIIVELITAFTSLSPFLLWFGIGFISQLFNLSYAILSQHFAKTHSGRANGALNILIFFSVFILQYIIGLLLDFFTNIEHQFSVQTYMYSFSIIIILQFISILWYFVFKTE